VALGLDRVQNGAFDSGLSPWVPAGGGTITHVNQAMHVVAAGGGVGGGSTLLTSASGNYVLRYNVKAITGSMSIQISGSGGGPYLSPAVNSAGVVTLNVTLNFTPTGIQAISRFAGATFDIDDISLRSNSMALASVGWEMTVTLADNGGGLSNLNYQLVAATAADAATAGGTIRTALAAVTGMSLMSYTLTERFVDAVAVLPGDDGVQRENRAKLNCVLNSGLKAETIYIPAPVIGIFEGTSGDAADRVDIADADLVAYLEIWKVSGALATLSDGEYLRDLLPCRSGIRTHRRSSFG
jgi:hypothetical protein